MAVEYVVNEMHVARYRIEGELTAEEERELAALPTDEQKIEYLRQKGVWGTLVNDSLEYSRTLEETARDFSFD